MAEFVNNRRNASPSSTQRGRLAGSGLITACILLVAVVIFGLYWQAHRRAAFHKLRTRETPPAPVVPMPGGQEAVTLTRLSLQDDAVPEFVSAVLLPGLGMQFQQATISVPGREGLSLLQGPTIAEAAAPSANVQTAPIHLYVSSAPFSAGKTDTVYDLIGSAPATSVETETIPDGGQASARFPAMPATSPDVTATVTTALNGHVLDLNVTAQNNASTNRYLSFEWVPRFALTGPNPAELTLTLPSRQMWKGSAQTAAPSEMDYASATGKALGPKPFDVTLVDLHTEILADGPAVRIADPRSGTVLRVTGFNPNIRSLQVQADPGTRTLQLGFRSIDPTPDGNRAGELLHPGQTASWHLRVEVLPFAAPARQRNTQDFE